MLPMLGMDTSICRGEPLLTHSVFDLNANNVNAVGVGLSAARVL